MSNNITGRAHTPEEKKAICDRLYAAWLKNPQQRLGQLLLNAARSETEFFYAEDQELIRLVEEGK